MKTTVEDRVTPEQAAKQEQIEGSARSIAELLDGILNPNMMRVPGERPKRDVGFAVLLFSFGEPPQPATWISNADRGDMIRAVEEWLEKAKSRQ